jgi:hypothetical protein
VSVSSCPGEWGEKFVRFVRSGVGWAPCPQEGATMTSDLELFAKGLATYQKVVNLNYMAHKEVYGLLRQVLVAEARDQFVLWT